MSPSKPGDPDEGQAGRRGQTEAAAEASAEAAAKEAAAEAEAGAQAAARARRRRRPRARRRRRPASRRTRPRPPCRRAAASPPRRRRRRRRAEAADEPAQTSLPPTSRRRDDAAPPTTRPPRPPAGAAGRARARRRAPGERVTVRAHAKYVRTSARKARLVCDHIRGKSVEEARAILAHTPRAVAATGASCSSRRSPTPSTTTSWSATSCGSTRVTADEGPTLKRFRPRAMGRATRIRKRTSHLTITLTPKE